MVHLIHFVGFIDVTFESLKLVMNVLLRGLFVNNHNT